MITDKDIITQLQSKKYELITSEQVAYIFNVANRARHKDLRMEDFERVYLLPLSVRVIVEPIELNGQKNLVEKLNNLGGLFKQLTQIDEKIDSGKNFSETELTSDSGISNYIESVRVKKDIDLSIWSNYTRFLERLYLPYGEYLTQTLNYPESNLALAFSNILVFQKVLDDVADWKEDLEEGKDTYITRLMEKQLGSVKELGRAQKEYFLVELLPLYLLNLEVMEDQQRGLELSSQELNQFYAHYLGETLAEIKQIRSVVSQFLGRMQS